MSSREPVPSLTELRRGRQRSASQPAMRGLFDDLPATSDQTTPQPATNAVPLTQAPAPVSRMDTSPEPIPEPRVWTVADLVRQVRTALERQYQHIVVEGEISNWRPAATGHCYFTLKDGSAQISVVMFRRQASLIRFAPKDGDAVRLRGQLSVYENRGQMQLIAEWMEPRGLGALLAATRELKEKLRREGLFDRKRPLPAFPRCIGVVTSVQGAALRDIVKVCRRRHSAVNLLIYPAAVQGPRCPVEVAAGLRWFGRHPERVDVVLVARGGGSWEDLHGFDDERVARAIAACPIPVIVGVGHATDSTIADAAADLCAPTPSAAAEIVTAAQHRVEEHVGRLSSRLLRAGRYELLHARQRVARLGADMVLRRILDGIERRAQRFDELDFRVRNTAGRRLRQASDRVLRTEARLLRQDPATRLRENAAKLAALDARLRTRARSLVPSLRLEVDHTSARLTALSPVKVLERGYALVYGPDGRLLRQSHDVLEGEQITARLHRGAVRAQVTGKS